MGTKASEPWAGFRGLLAEVERKSPLFTLSFHPVAFSQSASPSPHVPVFSVAFILLSSYLEAVTLLPPPLRFQIAKSLKSTSCQIHSLFFSHNSCLSNMTYA